MRLATVDIGNSSIKICHGEPAYDKEILKAGLAEAVEVCNRLSPDGVVFCSTRELSDSEKQLVEKAGWWEMKYGVKLPVKVNYATPETLGPDRLASAVGAMSRYKGRTLLVADAGTALTLDVVAADGIFLGGNISPGLSMRLSALNEHTSRLPLLDRTTGVKGYFGRDTSSAIMAGCRYGLAYEVEGAFRMARKELGCDMIVATGGDGSLLHDDLKQMFGVDFPVEFVPDLIADGLKIVYELNHE